MNSSSPSNSLPEWHADQSVAPGEAVVMQTPERDAMREGDSVLRAAFDMMADGLLIISASGRVMYYNQQYLDLHAIPLEWTFTEEAAPRLRLVGSTVPDPEAFQKRIAEIYQTQVRADDLLHLKNGRILERISYPLARPAGAEAERVWLFRDVTARMRERTAAGKRIEALTRPTTDVGNVRFEDLFDLEEIQRIQDLFADATGVASIITRADGTPITRPSRFCRLCREIIRETPLGRANCFQSDAALGLNNPDGPRIQPCLSGGLWDAGASIKAGGQHVANWLIGQVRDGTQTEEGMLEYARKIGADEGEFLKAFREVPSMSREQFNRVADALFTFANLLSKSAFQNLQQARHIAERKRAESALRASEARLTEVFANMDGAVFVLNAMEDGRLIYESFNPRCEEMTGLKSADVCGRSPESVLPPEEAAVLMPRYRECRDTGKVLHHEADLGYAPGRRFWSTTLVPICNEFGRVYRIAGFGHDITSLRRAEFERLEFERRMLHTQKLESLGVLAGGIAHDFNNLLMAILGNLDLALMDLSPVSPARTSIEQSVIAGRRAADLTRQMLAYSGRGRLNVGRVNLSDLIEQNAHLLRTCISKIVTLNLQIDRNLPLITADAGQLQQIVMNLVTNASEAIGERAGVITLATGVLDCSGDYLRRSRAEEIPMPGRFVFVSVADTGCGMDALTQQRLFDPFFTTKFMGRGLGMSAILGIVRGHKGAILVESEVGSGSSIQVLFPAVEKPAPAKIAEVPASAVDGSPAEAKSKSKGTILLVDDEDMVRFVCQRMLSHDGWKVLPAAGGSEAIKLFRQDPEAITCVLLDLSMPQMDGMAVFRELRAIRPDVKVIMSSGYSSDEGDGQQLLGKGADGFIQKPYTVEGFRRELARVLGLH
jgi:PAS domain S-box-containing protein